MADTVSELLPCPFCGNDGSGPIEDALHIAHSQCDWHPAYDVYAVQCDRCTANMGYSESEDDAAKAWNTRASTQPAPAFPREEVELIAATLWRNLEDGDQRMARENCACLSFLAKEGRLPSWEELAGAHEAMEAALLQGKQP